MKKLTKFAMMLLCGVFALSFTACSDDDDDNGGTTGNDRVAIPESVLSAAFNNYVNNIIYKNYEDLQGAAEDLQEACEALYEEKSSSTGEVTQNTINNACAKFKIARRYWEQSEAFLYGPATNDGLDPHTDTWPLDQSALAQALTNEGIQQALNSDNVQYLFNQNVDDGDFQSVLGYHGLEFILFRNGSPRTADAFNAETDDADGLNVKGKDLETSQRLLRTVPMLEEAAFARAISQDLSNATKLLAYEWDGNTTLKNDITTNAPWYWTKSQFTDESTHDFTTGMSYGERVNGIRTSSSTASYLNPSWQDNLQMVLISGCQNICQEVHTQKLGQAYRVAIGQPEESDEGEDAADYIESPYSKRSFIDYLDNIYGIRNVLYGVRSTREADEDDQEGSISIQPGSFMAILQQYYTNGFTIETKDIDGNPTGRTVTGSATALNDALTTAINTLNAARTSGTAFIDDPGNAQVLQCINAVQALDDQLSVASQWIMANVDIAQ